MIDVNTKIRLRVDGEIAVITSDNPPVNALGQEVRAGLVAAVRWAIANDAVRAIVVACVGKTFFAGADITEFGKPRQAPSLHDVIDTIEGCRKPVIAAMHGTALGGGLETALGAHFRVAVPTAQLGLPEIRLGLFPGAGGTQRLPRLVGPIEALRLVLSGDRVPAARALALGIVDHVAEGDPVSIGVEFARRVLAEAMAVVAVRDRGGMLAAVAADASGFEAEAAALLERRRLQDAPVACVESLRRSFTMPIDAALRLDQASFERLVEGEQARALRHLFFAEREAAKLPNLPSGTSPRPIRKAVVIGAGTMGGGIAMSLVAAGIPVALVDATEAGLTAGLARVRANYATSVRRGSIRQAEMDARLAMIDGGTDRAVVAGADVVIEAVFEDMGVKAEIFSDIARRTGPGVVMATNTSALDIDAIAAASGRPDDVVGMHFFSPANVMRLLEVVRGAATGAAAIATAMAVGRAMGKAAVLSGNCDGFIGNRIMARRSAQVDQLLLEGAMPRDIDAALKGFGFAMGPLETNDMSGLDIGWSIRKRRGTPFPVADAICERGWFGQKAGRGYYLYEKGSRTPLVNPDVEALVIERSADLGVARRSISDVEMVERMVFPLVNEGARILLEGIAARPGDIDVVWTTGYGFPAWRGGPMFHADRLGLKHVAERLDGFAAQTGSADLQAAPLLRELADAGSTFAEWSAARRHSG